MLAETSAARACPLDQLRELIREPLAAYEMQEVSATERRSTEGGVWWLYYRPNRRLHSIVRTDFGETGRRSVRISFIDSKNFGIVDTMSHYDMPISPDRSVQIVGQRSVEYFFCDPDEVVSGRTDAADERTFPGPMPDARDLRNLFFHSADIVPYLRALD